MDYQAEARRWHDEAESLRSQLRQAQDDNAQLREKIKILESAMRTAARGLLNYVTFNK